MVLEHVANYAPPSAWPPHSTKGMILQPAARPPSTSYKGRCLAESCDIRGSVPEGRRRVFSPVVPAAEAHLPKGGARYCGDGGRAAMSCCAATNPCANLPVPFRRPGGPLSLPNRGPATGKGPAPWATRPDGDPLIVLVPPGPRSSAGTGAAMKPVRPSPRKCTFGRRRERWRGNQRFSPRPRCRRRGRAEKGLVREKGRFYRPPQDFLADRWGLGPGPSRTR